MLYCVNMASYKAISPLCPAAAQARASRTGTAYRDNEQLWGSDPSRHDQRSEQRQRHQPLTMSFSWLWPEWSACLTLWESKISWRNRCFPKATAPLVTIIISRPWFCSIDTCKYRRYETGPAVWSLYAQHFRLSRITSCSQFLLTQVFHFIHGSTKATRL